LKRLEVNHVTPGCLELYPALPATFAIIAVGNTGPSAAGLNRLPMEAEQMFAEERTQSVIDAHGDDLLISSALAAAHCRLHLSSARLMALLV
jgi:hypothetical protein